jgi:hypothetical protein
VHCYEGTPFIRNYPVPDAKPKIAAPTTPLLMVFEVKVTTKQFRREAPDIFLIFRSSRKTELEAPIPIVVWHEITSNWQQFFEATPVSYRS